MNQEGRIFRALSKAGIRLRIIGLALIILAFILFITYSTRQHQQIIIRDSIITTQDSVITHLTDSIREPLSEQEMLSSQVIEYIRLRNEHKADSMELFYADTLARYFKNIKNSSKSDATQSDKRYWRSFPNDEYVITGPVQIIGDSAAGKRAMVAGDYCRTPKKCQPMVLEIGFGIDNKITSVRAYYARPGR